MKLSRINDYLVGIDVLITEESMRAIDFMMIPHVKEETQKETIDRYYPREEDQGFKDKPVVTTEKVSMRLMAVAYGMHA